MNQTLRNEPKAFATLINPITASPKPHPMDPEEAAEFMRVPRRRMLEWARRGYVPAHPIGEGCRKMWRFYEHELEAWLNEQTNGALTSRR